MTVGSLFAGIGGFDLGFTRAGFDIRWQVEIDPFCRAVLARHWPEVTRYADVRSVGREQLESTEVICGGFPCQPHSLAGRRAASADERDLWPEFARVIREVRPRWIVAENVPGLLSSEAGRFFGTVLGDLAACGYDAEWDCLPASAFGAPHRRDRVWIVAYPERPRLEGFAGHGDDGDESRRLDALANGSTRARGVLSDAAPAGMGDADEPRLQGRSQFDHGPAADAGSLGRGRIFTGALGADGWLPEPDVGRVAHGVPNRVDRLRSLGNAIVPQIAEWIARRILEAEGNTA